MTKPRSEQSSIGSSAGFSAFLAILLGCTIFYPQVATWIHRVITRREGWDGSALVYTQIAFVLPGSAVLAALTVVAYLYSRRRSARAEWRVLSLAWVAFVMALIGSVIWYGSMAG
jgi:hypothetical protein